MIILASASPRRRELLNQIGCNFQCMASAAEEDNSQNVSPERLAVKHALMKAHDVAAKNGRNIPIVGADTIVVADGEIFGKPTDRGDAIRMLTRLSGREHEVYTGIALIYKNGVWSDVEKTTVNICELTQAEIESYVATGEPMDKAGAYAIQGIATVYIERISGCYSNVVGLPLNKLLRMCRKAGVELR